jgi:hypothetical protein
MVVITIGSSDFMTMHRLLIATCSLDMDITMRD